MTFARPTPKERAIIRAAVYGGGVDLGVFYAGDGTWCCEVEVGAAGSVWIEGASAAETLREVALILEES